MTNQTIKIAIERARGATPIFAGMQYLISKNKQTLIPAYIAAITTPSKFDIKKDNSKYQVLYAAHEYAKKSGRAGVKIDPFDLLKSWNLSEIYPLYVSLYGEQNPADKGVIGEFIAKARTWAANVKNLVNTPMANAQLDDEKTKLLNRAKLLKSAIDSVLPNVNLNTGLNAAPIAWLITGGVIAGFLAAMTAWSAKSVALITKSNNETQRFTQDPQAAIDYQAALTTTEKAKQSGSFANVLTQGKNLLIIGGLIYILYRFGGVKRGN